MAIAAPQAAIPARIVHHIPGRLRLRLKPCEGYSDAIGRLCETAHGLPGVTAATPSPVIGGVLVLYDPAILPPQQIAEMLRLAPPQQPASQCAGRERIADLAARKLLESIVESLARAALAAAF